MSTANGNVHAHVDPAHPPEMLVFKRSPLGSYVLCRQFIETALTDKYPGMKKAFAAAEALYKSNTMRVSVAMRGVHQGDALKNQSALWRDMVPKRMKVVTKSGAVTEPTPQDHAKLRTVEARPLSSDALVECYIDVSMRDLLSVLQFVGEEDTLRDDGDKAAGSVRLPEPCKRLTDAWGLDPVLLERAGRDPVLDNVLTFDRLVRQFRNQFVLSAGTHKERFESVLVRHDSAFFENVILASYMKNKNQPLIPCSGMYAYTIPAAGESLETDGGHTCAACIAKHVSCTHNAPVFHEGRSVLYVEMSFEYVFKVVTTLATELHQLFTYSRDDML